MDEHFTVMIVGGGPAGAASAITLARLGHRALLVDDGTGAFKIGEALAPAVRSLLRDLGVADRFLSDSHLPCYGNVSAWGSEEAHPTDFVFNPHGHGWHLDRLRFEAMLRDAARNEGAALSHGARFTAAERGEGFWRVTLKAGGASRVVLADWLVDATGRRSAVARRMGAKRVQDDRLVAYHTRFQQAEDSHADQDARAFVESVPDGWWYTAIVPSGERVVAYLTDSDLAIRAELTSAEGFSTLLSATRHVGRLVEGRHLAAAPRGAEAGSARLDRFGGEGWVAVGDAAISFDPLSSQGILHALHSGLKAGDAIARSLAGDPHPLELYQQQLHEIYGAYRANLRTYYAAETRWRDRPFWRRRAGEKG
jgi:flavin-dependent dehydrogenase